MSLPIPPPRPSTANANANANANVSVNMNANNNTNTNTNNNENANTNTWTHMPIPHEPPQRSSLLYAQYTPQPQSQQHQSQSQQPQPQSQQLQAQAQPALQTLPILPSSSMPWAQLHMHLQQQQYQSLHRNPSTYNQSSTHQHYPPQIQDAHTQIHALNQNLNQSQTYHHHQPLHDFQYPYNHQQNQLPGIHIMAMGVDPSHNMAWRQDVANNHATNKIHTDALAKNTSVDGAKDTVITPLIPSGIPAPNPTSSSTLEQRKHKSHATKDSGTIPKLQNKQGEKPGISKKLKALSSQGGLLSKVNETDRKKPTISPATTVPAVPVLRPTTTKVIQDKETNSETIKKQGIKGKNQTIQPDKVIAPQRPNTNIAPPMVMKVDNTNLHVANMPMKFMKKASQTQKGRIPKPNIAELNQNGIATSKPLGTDLIKNENGVLGAKKDKPASNKLDRKNVMLTDDELAAIRSGNFAAVATMFKRKLGKVGSSKSAKGKKPNMPIVPARASNPENTTFVSDSISKIVPAKTSALDGLSNLGTSAPLPTQADPESKKAKRPKKQSMAGSNPSNFMPVHASLPNHAHVPMPNAITTTPTSQPFFHAPPPSMTFHPFHALALASEMEFRKDQLASASMAER